MIQEIRDVSETAFPKLMRALNDANAKKYNFVLSSRKGRTKRCKEQYAFVYR